MQNTVSPSYVDSSKERCPHNMSKRQRRDRFRAKMTIGTIIAAIFILLAIFRLQILDRRTPVNQDLQIKKKTFAVRSILSVQNSNITDEEEVECQDLHKPNVTDICKFVTSTNDCHIGAGFINYVKVVYCKFPTLVPLGVILLTIWWLFLFASLASIADEFFCPNLAVISKTLRLSQNIAGVTFLAFGNGAPDIFSSISAVGNAKDGDTGLAIGALVGAGVFVTTVVAASISIACPFTSMERPFLRDIIFYLGAVFWTFYVLFDGAIDTGEAIGFICLYVCYVVLVVVGRAVYQYRKNTKKNPKPYIPGITEEDLHGWYLMSFVKYSVFHNPDSPQNSPQIFRRYSRNTPPEKSSVSTISAKIDNIDGDPESLELAAQFSIGDCNDGSIQSAPTYGTVHSGENNVVIVDPDSTVDDPDHIDVLSSDPHLINDGNIDALKEKANPTKAVKGLARFAELVSFSSVFGREVIDQAGLIPTSESTDDLTRAQSSSSLRQLLATARGSITSSFSLAAFRRGKLKSHFRTFLKALNPINTEEWSSFNFFGKALEIFKSPMTLAAKLTIPLVSYDDEEELHNWNRILGSLQCIISPLFCVFAIRVAFVKIGGVLPLWGLILVLVVPLSLVVFFTSNFEKKPVYHWVFAYAGFLLSVIWIYTIANEIINLLQMFGVVFSISNAILGLTLLAWGNSVGDLIANTATARQGFPRMGISACFGGPLFNMLMGIGIPFTIGTIKNNGHFKLRFTLLQMVLVCALAGSLIMSLIIIPVRKFKFGPGYGGFLISYYVIFLILALLVETHVIPSTYWPV